MAVPLRLVRTTLTLALRTLASTAFILAALMAGGLASTERVSAQQVPSADFTVKAQGERHGIQLTWDFELSSLPSSWRVRAVEIHRKSEHSEIGYALVARDEIEESLHKSTSFSNRSYFDYLVNPYVDIRERDTRSIFLYKFRVVFDNGTDGHEFVGNFAGETKFRVPVIPTPPGYSVIMDPHRNTWRTILAEYFPVWRTPHLSWSANFNLGSVAEYLFYIDGRLVSRLTPHETKIPKPHPYGGVGDHHTSFLLFVGGDDSPKHHTYALRVSFGAFYSSLVTVHWWCGSYLPAPC